MAKKTDTGEAKPSPPAKADHAADARALMRRSRAAMVSTALKSGDGWPYGSLVSVAFDSDLSPLMLFSTLSDHTRNLAQDPRASLLFEETSRLKNPQTGPRVSVLGLITKTSAERHQRRFLALHPEAAVYAGFGDFGFERHHARQPGGEILRHRSHGVDSCTRLLRRCQRSNFVRGAEPGFVAGAEPRLRRRG